MPKVKPIPEGMTAVTPHLICANAGWLSNEQVRRTLLANSALRGQNMMTVLRQLSKSELELATRQTAYSPAVRHAARQLLGK